MDPDSRVPSSRPFVSRLGRPAMTRTRRNTSSAAHSPFNPLSSHNLNVEHVADTAKSGNGYPHVEGWPDCRCAACHLKNKVFPRRQDGRIVLPVPWLLTSQPGSSSSPMPPRISTPQPRGLGERQTHVLPVRGPRTSTVHHRWATQTDVQSSGLGSMSPNTDRGEGSSQIVRQLSGPGVAPAEDYNQSVLTTDDAYRQQTESSSQLVAQDGRLHRSDRARSSQFSKPYERHQVQLRTQSGLDIMELQSPQRHPDSSSSLRPAQIILDSREYTRDPYETIQSERFPQLLEPTRQLGYNPGDISRPPTFGSQYLSQGQSTEVDRPDAGPLAQAQRIYPSWENQQIDQGNQMAPSTQHDALQQETPQQYPSLEISPELQTFRFNSLSHNPQPRDSRSPALMHHITTSNDHGAATFSPRARPAMSLFTWRPGDDDLQSPVRFQEPVVPEDLSGSSDHQREQLAIKWDSERKRRQGYFAQVTEGEEKSNFRHYNQSKIDYDK